MSEDEPSTRAYWASRLTGTYLWAALCAFLAAAGVMFAARPTEHIFGWWFYLGTAVMWAYYAHKSYHRAEDRRLAKLHISRGAPDDRAL